MQPSIFKFIWNYSRREQIFLLILTLASFPFLYLSLDLPKTIINEAIGGRDFPKLMLGQELDQVAYLLLLCFVFLALVLMNGAFKYFVNVYRGVVGERMLRRLRYLLFDNLLRFPLERFKRTSQGELVSMITAETEPLGGYIGDSIALPVFQGGTLITILVFMFVQDWVLGIAAVSLYPLQAWLIPKLQRKVNLLKKERTLEVRRLSERIGEVVSSADEVHAHDTSRYELADFSGRVGKIFYIRFEIYKKKFLIKFLNNFIAQITPFFFYAVGGYLVIKGNLSFGALVAVLAAYKDLSSPWKELLDYYQIMEDARIKYGLLHEHFELPDLLDARLQDAEPPEEVPLTGPLIASNLDISEDAAGEGAPALVSFQASLPTQIALLGDTGSGRSRTAAAIAGLNRPRSGSLTLGGFDLLRAPESVTGRRMGLVGRDVKLCSGSLRANIEYALKHRAVETELPAGPEGDELKRRRVDARLAGNSIHDAGGQWIDYAAMGLSGPGELTARILDALDVADMGADVLGFGLSRAVDPQAYPGLAEQVMRARSEFRALLEDDELSSLVSQFDKTEYNSSMTVAENLVFGTPRDESFNFDSLASNAYVRKVLEAGGLWTDLVNVGRDVAELMLELFSDVEPGSELFERFSFIDAADLPEFRTLLSRTAGVEGAVMADGDRERFLSLVFKLVPARHRLGVVSDELRARLLQARKRFAEGFGKGAPPVDFFDAERYNPAVSIQDNILFGRLAYGRPRSAARVGAAIRDIVRKLDMEALVMAVGLDYEVGIGGSRLSQAQRQKVALARCVLKRPEILVLDEATAALDDASQARVFARLMSEFGERSLIWLLHRASLASAFQHILVMEDCKVVEEGTYEQLSTKDDTVFSELTMGA
ncbi:MAG: ABC transporter transmembrane domain-containing protein [Gammaproteobacteria bacterium]